jgi:RNA polymerase sigma-70 factor (ECF subfamily)
MYETYAGRVLAVCRRYIRDADRARDLVHDTFLKAWESLDRFRPRRAGSFGAWLCQIAVHLTVDELRRGRHFLEIPDQVRDDGGSFRDDGGSIRNGGRTGNDGPEEPPVDPDRLRQIPVEELIGLIASLPEGYRTVFNLYVFEDKSHQEIARLLGISVGTSSSQLCRAKNMLADMIREYNDKKRLPR